MEIETRNHISNIYLNVTSKNHATSVFMRLKVCISIECGTLDTGGDIDILQLLVNLYSKVSSQLDHCALAFGTFVYGVIINHEPRCLHSSTKISLQDSPLPPGHQ